MKWNLRLAAANHGIWKASEMQRLLAERGLIISAGKMSGLWSGKPASIKLSDLNVICAVLDCGVGDLLIPEFDQLQAVAKDGVTDAAVNETKHAPTVKPRRRAGRSLPPA